MNGESNLIQVSRERVDNCLDVINYSSKLRELPRLCIKLVL